MDEQKTIIGFIILIVGSLFSIIIFTLALFQVMNLNYKIVQRNPLSMDNVLSTFLVVYFLIVLLLVLLIFGIIILCVVEILLQSNS